MKRWCWIVVLFTGVESNAQHVFRSVQDVWTYAEEHNVQVRLTQKQMLVAKAGVRQAYANLLPAATLNGTFTDNVLIQPTLVPAELFGGPSGTFVEEKFGKRYNYSVGLSAQIDLLNVSNWLTIGNARQEEVVSNLRWQLSKEEADRQSAQAYFNYYLMQQAALLAGESRKTAEAIFARTQSLYTQGQVSEVLLNKAEIQRRNAEAIEYAAQENQRVALNQLKQLLDMTLEDSIQLQDDLLLEPVMDDSAVSVFSALNVQLANAQWVSAKSSFRVSQAAFVPTLTAVYANSTKVTGNEWLNFSNSNTLPQQYWGLRLSIPVLARQTRKFQMDKAHREAESKQLQYESVLRQTSIEDENLIRALKLARRTLSTSQSVLELYRRNDLHAADLLSGGQLSLDERLRIYQEYINYKNEYLYNLSQFFMRYAEVQIRLRKF